MNHKLAVGISWITHPLLMPTFLCILIRRFVPPALDPLEPRIFNYLLLLIFLSSFLIPVLSIMGLQGVVSMARFRLEQRRERILPFTLITLFYLVMAYFFKVKLDVNPLIQRIFISISIILILVTLLTLFLKISIHATAAGGLTGYFLALAYLFPRYPLYIPVCGMILLSGIILSSRLQLNAHTPVEAYAGFSLGLLVSLIGLIL